jgi:hypothetical protein
MPLPQVHARVLDICLLPEFSWAAHDGSVWLGRYPVLDSLSLYRP